MPLLGATAVRPWGKAIDVRGKLRLLITRQTQDQVISLGWEWLRTSLLSEWSSITLSACSTYPMAFTLSAGVFRAKLIVQIALNQRENFSIERELWSRLARRIASKHLYNTNQNESVYHRYKVKAIAVPPTGQALSSHYSHDNYEILCRMEKIWKTY